MQLPKGNDTRHKHEQYNGDKTRSQTRTDLKPVLKIPAGASPIGATRRFGLGARFH